MPVGFNRVEDNWPESFKGYLKDDPTQTVYTFIQVNDKYVVINDDSGLGLEIDPNLVELLTSEINDC